MRRPLGIVGLTAVTLLAASVGGCTAYVETGDLRTLVAQPDVQELHVGRRDGQLAVLQYPTLRGDTLWGFSASDTLRARRIGVAVTDVEWAMSRGYRAGGRGSVIGTIALLFTGFLIYAGSQFGG